MIDINSTQTLRNWHNYPYDHSNRNISLFNCRWSTKGHQR